MKYRWLEEELWNLYNLSLQQCKALYPECQYVSQTRLQYVRKIKTGEIKMPEKHTFDGDLDKEKNEIAKRQGKVAPKLGELATLQVKVEHLRYYEEMTKALEEHESITKASFTDWQGFYKDAEGNAEVVDLKRSRFDVKFDHEPLWTPIAPVELSRPLLRRQEKGKNPTEMHTTVVIPDLQIPFVDPKALEVFYQVLGSLKADNVVQLGDALDLTAYSRFMDSQLYADTTQDALIQGLEFFRNVRKLQPAAKITMLAGNHEERLPKDIATNHRRNFGLRPADDPTGDPLLSVPRMLGLKSVDVEYLPGYPANRYWVNDNLQIVHGTITGRNENKRVNFHEKVSSIHGHTHRLGSDRQTINSRDRGEYRIVQNAGTLSRIDKHVPSTNTGYDLQGQPLGGHYENWQHGFLVITHNDTRFNIEEISIDTFNSYQTMFRGKVYTPDLGDGIGG